MVSLIYVYHGHSGKGPFPQEAAICEAARDVGLDLRRLTFHYPTAFEVEFGVIDPEDAYHVPAMLTLHAASVREITAWLDAYGRGEVWE